MVDITFRPIDQWPDGWRDPGRAGTRLTSPFKVGYPTTLIELRDELWRHGATTVHVQLDVRGAELRQDGMLRANATVGHPGVILTVVSPERSIVLATDRFTAEWRRMEDWHCNLRACLLGLVDLRRMERYGLNGGDAQYAGFAALGTGNALALGAGRMSHDVASAFLRDAADWPDGPWDPHDRRHIDTAYRMAARRYHPDRNHEDANTMAHLNEAKAVLDAQAR